METAGLRNARGTNLIRPRCTRAPSPEGKAVCSECGGFAQRPGGAPHPPSLLSGAFPRGERLHAQKAAGSRNARGTNLIRPRCARAPSPEGKAVRSEHGGFAQRPRDEPHPLRCAQQPSPEGKATSPGATGSCNAGESAASDPAEIGYLSPWGSLHALESAGLRDPSAPERPLQSPERAAKNRPSPQGKGGIISLPRYRQLSRILYSPSMNPGRGTSWAATQFSRAMTCPSSSTCTVPSTSPCRTGASTRSGRASSSDSPEA